jgi:hypothetical protein
VRTWGIVIAMAVLAAGIAACGEKTVDKDSAEETVANVVAEQTGFEAEDVECPEDVKAEADEKFTCTFTGPEGPYEADVTITEVDGDNAVFDVVSRRAD